MNQGIPHLRRSRKISLRKQVTAILRNEILSGRVKPGSILYERELAKQLGVSKTPVRESLTVLDHEGLVRTLPRKGYLVNGYTVQDVHNLFDLRVILESAAVELAASRMTDEQLQALTALAPDGNAGDEMLKRLDRNVDLHYSLALLSGNDRLAALIKKLIVEMRRMIAAGYVPNEHEKLLAALKERDPKRAAEAMRNHINAVRERALRLAPSPLASSGSSDRAPTEKSGI